MSRYYSYDESDASSQNYFEEEDPRDYKYGGYHPVDIGDVYNGVYKIVKKIGWGHFSTVWLALDMRKNKTNDNRYVAIKFHKSSEKHAMSAMVELENLECVRSMDPPQKENVVSLLNCFVHKGIMGTHICLVFEVLGENLFNKMVRLDDFKKASKSRNFRDDFTVLPYEEIKMIARDLLSGLAFLHEKCRLIHTDIKPENISYILEKPLEVEKMGLYKASTNSDLIKMHNKIKHDSITEAKESIKSAKPLKPSLEREIAEITEKINESLNDLLEKNSNKEESPTPTKNGAKKEGDLNNSRRLVKIVDLGTSVTADKSYTDEITTRQYRAPEVILGQRYSTAVDVWSVACVIFEIATGDVLFDPRADTKLGEYDKDDDHLAQMIETIGPMPKEFALKGECARRFFNMKGKLRRIKKINNWCLDKILESKYKFPPEEAKSFTDFLLPMLLFSPSKRVTAKEALKHPWLNDK